MLINKLIPLSSSTKYIVYDVDTHTFIQLFETEREAKRFIRTNFIMNEFHLGVLPVDLQAEINYIA